MQTRVMVTTLALTCLLCLSLPAASPAYRLSDHERQVLTLINKKRTQQHLTRLTINTKLLAAARGHSQEMADEQYFSHDSSSGETFRQRLISYGFTRKGYRVWKVGENLAWGSGLCGTPVAIVRQWLASPTHRKVLLTRSFRVAGVGAVLAAQGYGECRDPVWFVTLDLGRRSR